MVLDSPGVPRVIPPSGDGGLPVRLDVVSRLLRGLNREQRRAVTHRDGPQLVIAGPGTGKTEVITRRVAWLIATRRARPAEILALTFTEAAAQEMQARVDVLVPYGQADAAIHTFHAFGDRLLREHAFELGLPGDLRLINRAEGIVLLRDHMFDLGLERYLPLGNPTRFLGALVDLFMRAKDERIEPGQLTAFARMRASAAVDAADRDAAASLAEQAAAYERYQSLLATRGLIDHGDQLAQAQRLLDERPAVRRAVRQRFRYLLVDEYQDMNRAQMDLLAALTPVGDQVTVVGDPNQAIYEFRGAAGENARRFARVFPSLTRVVLRRNYRSRRPIIDATQRLISHGPSGPPPLDEQPVAARRGARKSAVWLTTYRTPEEEGEGVARRIADRVAGGEPAHDFAVIARSNAEAESVARSLIVHGVPVRRSAPMDFFAQRSVRPLVALLRFAADPSQTLELYVLATAWPYELGGSELTDLLAQSRRTHRPLWQLLCDFVDANPAHGRLARRAARLVADLRAAIDLAHQRSAGELLYDHLRRSGRLARLASDGRAAEASGVARFFQIVASRTALLSDPRAGSVVPHLDQLIEAQEDVPDDGPLDADAVAVLTAHRAKGLEFRVVFLIGLTDGRFPARARPAALSVPWNEVRGEPPTDDETNRIQEERRLCYVAMSRARDELWLSGHRSGPGGRTMRRPSPFIAETLDLPVEQPAVGVAPLEHIAVEAGVHVGGGSEVNLTRPAAPPAFSFSQLEEYLDCPERYRLRHVVGLPVPAHHSLSYGRAIHGAVAEFHLRTGRGEQVTDEQLIDSFRRAWTPEGFLSREHEETRFEAGRRALLDFRAQQMAHPASVIAIERPFDFRLGTTRIRGRMDRVDRDAEGVVIVDYKSSDVRDQGKADQRARESLQLQVYALAWQAETGSLPSAMRLHFLDSGAIGQTEPDPGRLDRARTKIEAAATGVAAGHFDANPNPVACGYCPFRQICPSSAA